MYNIPKVTKKSEGAIFRQVLLNLMLFFVGGVVVISTLLRLYRVVHWTALTEFLLDNWAYTLLGLVVHLILSYCAASSREETRVREQKALYSRLDWGL
jgi:hypothetical protein